jgi:hypothetical protein
MAMIVLVGQIPRTQVSLDATLKLANDLQCPAGVVNVAENVWLVDPERAAQFIIDATAAARQAGFELRAYGSVPEFARG